MPSRSMFTLLPEAANDGTFGDGDDSVMANYGVKVDILPKRGTKQWDLWHSDQCAAYGGIFVSPIVTFLKGQSYWDDLTEAREREAALDEFRRPV